jgi:hypothetical protein
MPPPPRPMPYIGRTEIHQLQMDHIEKLFAKQCCRTEEPKLSCLLELEPKLRFAAPAPAPFFLSETSRNFIEKIMIAKEVFVYCHNFNLIWVQHASINVKKYWY